MRHSRGVISFSRLSTGPIVAPGPFIKPGFSVSVGLDAFPPPFDLEVPDTLELDLFPSCLEVPAKNVLDFLVAVLGDVSRAWADPELETDTSASLP